MKRIITILADIPSGVSKAELEDFVNDSISSWGGQFPLDHPLFESLDVLQINISKGVK